MLSFNSIAKSEFLLQLAGALLLLTGPEKGSIDLQQVVYIHFPSEIKRGGAFSARWSGTMAKIKSNFMCCTVIFKSFSV